jgi:hypothetical protein
VNVIIMQFSSFHDHISCSTLCSQKSSIYVPPQSERPDFALKEYEWQNYSFFYILIFSFFIWEGKTKDFGVNDSKHSLNFNIITQYSITAFLKLKRQNNNMRHRSACMLKCRLFLWLKTMVKSKEYNCAWTVEISPNVEECQQSAKRWTHQTSITNWSLSNFKWRLIVSVIFSSG